VVLSAGELRAGRAALEVVGTLPWGVTAAAGGVCEQLAPLRAAAAPLRSLPAAAPQTALPRRRLETGSQGYGSVLRHALRLPLQPRGAEWEQEAGLSEQGPWSDAGAFPGCRTRFACSII